MIQIETVEQFRALIVAQSDDNDYSESGYVVLADTVHDWAAIAAYSHCSCYDTWDSLTDQGKRGKKWDWEGTIEQLIDKAYRREDVVIAGRVIDPQDNDYDHLEAAYMQVLAWAEDIGKAGLSLRG